MSKYLVVPVRMEALIAADKKRIFRRGQVSYRRQINFKSHLPEPFEGKDLDAHDKEGRKGVFLHWELPRAFYKAQTDNEGNVSLKKVPNRWLVVRTLKPANSSPTTEYFFIKSDKISDKWTSSTKSIFLKEDGADPCYIGSKQKVDSSHPLKVEDIEGNGEMFLTAMGAANPYFSTYQPFNENVFSIHDSEIPTLDEQKLSYKLIGWSSSKNNEDLIFGNTKDPQRIFEIMEEMGWSEQSIKTDAENPKIEKVFYYGIINDVDFKGTKEGEIPSSVPDPEFMKIGFGHSVSEAYAGLAKDEGIISDEEELLLRAFMEDLMDIPDVDHLGGVKALHAELEAKDFAPTRGGYLWTLEPKEEDNNHGAGKAIKWDEDLKVHLATINKAQRELDRALWELKSLQEDIYRRWINAEIHMKHFKREGERKERTAASRIKSYIKDKLVHPDTGFQRMKGDIKRAIIVLEGCHAFLNLTNPDLAWVKKPGSSFYSPKAPIIMLMNARGNKLTDYTGKTECYLLPDTVDSNEPVTYFHGSSKLPKAVVHLLQHEPEFPIPPENERNINHHIHESKHWNGQPWTPMFLDWELGYYPADNFKNQWEFTENGYRLEDSVPLTDNDFFLVRGRIHLGAACGTIVKGKYESFLKKHEHDPRVSDKIKAELEHILRWDILSQSLPGLNRFISSLVVESNRYPVSTNSKELEFDIAGLLNLTFDDVFIGEDDLKSENSWNAVKQALLEPELFPSLRAQGDLVEFFQFLRAGQFFVNRLSLQDKFGQEVQIVESGNENRRRVVVPQGMKVFHPMEDERRGHLFQLVPKINQAAQLVPYPAYHKHKGTDTDGVAGWVLHNYMESSLVFYQPNGKFVGELIRGKTGGEWSGRPRDKYLELKDLKADFETLHGFIQAIKKLSAKDFDTILEYIDDQVARIEPGSEAFHSEVVHIYGRPLALMEMSFEVELQGEPLKTSSPEGLRMDTDVADYAFPVKIGDPDHYRDGLIGYFTSKKGGDFDFSAMHAYRVPHPKFLKEREHPGSYPTLSVGKYGASVSTFLFLWDPQAPIHLETAILPVFRMEFPDEILGQVLPKMGHYFRMDALLTKKTITTEEKRTITLPQPPAIMGDWVWLQTDEDEKWEEASIIDTDNLPHLSSRNDEIREGFLRLIEHEATPNPENETPS